MFFCALGGELASAALFRHGHLFFVLLIRLQNQIAHAILSGRVGHGAQQRKAPPLALTSRRASALRSRG